MRRRRMDVSQERSKEKRNRASCVSRFREFLFISVRAIRLTACFVKGAHWRFFPGSFCQTQMPQCHQRPMKTRELILTSRLRFFDLRTPEQLFAHSNRRLESWLATALLASGAECLLASVRARPPFERHTHPPASSRVHAQDVRHHSLRDPVRPRGEEALGARFHSRDEAEIRPCHAFARRVRCRQRRRRSRRRREARGRRDARVRRRRSPRGASSDTTASFPSHRPDAFVPASNDG